MGAETQVTGPVENAVLVTQNEPRAPLPAEVIARSDIPAVTAADLEAAPRAMIVR